LLSKTGGPAGSVYHRPAGMSSEIKKTCHLDLAPIRRQVIDLDA
jgi:hypothetical protein